jgi:DNA processing protein
MLALPLSEKKDQVPAKAVSPFVELGAYEALWDEKGTTFVRLAEKFEKANFALPSSFVPKKKALEYAHKALKRLRDEHVHDFGVRVYGAGEYPDTLRDAKYPIALLYFQGWWDLINSRCIAVVGSRHPTEDGLARTRKLVRALVADDFTIVSGMASGIDREAHITAIKCGGRTIAVLGTPLTRKYPAENSELQSKVAEEFLVVSQVPIVRYEKQDYRSNRSFFPERNKTMSALTEATIIVEASETSGTLIQAKAAFEQGRKLFILDSCFKRDLTWPAEFEKRGAIRVRSYDDIKKALPKTSNGGRRIKSARPLTSAGR